MNFFINHVNFKVNKVKFNADFVSEKTINLNNINSVNSSEKTLEQNLIEEQWYIQIDKSTHCKRYDERCVGKLCRTF